MCVCVCVCVCVWVCVCVCVCVCALGVSAVGLSLAPVALSLHGVPHSSGPTRWSHVAPSGVSLPGFSLPFPPAWALPWLSLVAASMRLYVARVPAMQPRRATRSVHLTEPALLAGRRRDLSCAASPRGEHWDVLCLVVLVLDV